MVTRVDKFLGGLGADVTNVANVHATENRIAFGASINPTANLHVVGNAHVSTSISASSADFDGGVTIDNITIDGTEIDLSAGDLTIDAAGKIVLDAANTGGFTEFHDDGTAYGSISQDSNNMRIRSLINNGDVIIQGLDGVGSVVNMAQFYGDQAGAVKLFNNLMLQSDSAVVKMGLNDDIDLTHVHDSGLTLTNRTTGDDSPVVFQLKSSESIISTGEVIASIEMAAGDVSGGDASEVAAGIHAIAEGSFASSSNPTKLVFTTGVSEAADASATAKMTLSSAGKLTIADDLVIKNGGTIGTTTYPTAITIGSDSVVTFVDDIKIKNNGTIGTVFTPGAMTIDTVGKVTLADDLAVTGNAIVTLGLGVAGNTSPVGGSFGGISLGTPANVVIRTGGTSGGGNVIIGDATATSGFNLDVRGTANTGALTASNLTVNGTLDCGTL